MSELPWLVEDRLNANSRKSSQMFQSLCVFMESSTIETPGPVADTMGIAQTNISVSKAAKIAMLFLSGPSAIMF